jgi:retinol dehydrogenase 12
MLTSCSTVLDVFFVRELSKHLSSDKLVVSAPCPGFCVSELRRDFTAGSSLFRLLEIILEKLVMFTTEQGARNFVHCALSKDIGDVHGQFVLLSKPQETSDFVLSEKGAELQKRFYVSVSVMICMLPHLNQFSLI